MELLLHQCDLRPRRDQRSWSLADILGFQRECFRQPFLYSCISGRRTYLRALPDVKDEPPSRVHRRDLLLVVFNQYLWCSMVWRVRIRLLPHQM